MEKDVLKLLRELGVIEIYTGCRAVVQFVILVFENEDRLLNITETCKEIAAENNTTWMAVERNIRTIIHRAWNKNPKRLSEMAGYPLDVPPTVSEFLEFVYTDIARNYVSK
ncbi:MAG: sporulation initiation factor Spo0A C-terminal domain-containing protein [Clostridia bacterium]|nr:sporulation initiation factor Spo0A C-terminal domain-containing protein [Clostridia bacterium]